MTNERPPQEGSVQQTEVPKFMSYELVEKWGDGIPAYAEADPKRPEWRPTRVIPMDLRSDGYGELSMKDEGDPASNRTRTIKDRAAWELATLYRDYARGLYLKIRAGRLSKEDLKRMVVPRLSLVTSGNEGRALAECFARYHLPPPKLVVGSGTAPKILESLRKLPAEIFVRDLSQRLTGEEIKKLSDNVGGVDITSVRSLEVNAVFYDWHVHEVFNLEPDEVYAPYGSGRLIENYLTWQERTMRNAGAGVRDPRLRASAASVASIDVFGAEPPSMQSRADKLTAPFKPFLTFNDEDIDALVNFSFTGSQTGVQKFREDYLDHAMDLMKTHGIEAEPSAAAGLALYLERWDRGLIDERKKIVVVSTGIGLTE